MSNPGDGERVRLRVPAMEDVPLLDAWAASVETRGEFNDFGLPPKESLADTAAKGEFVTETRGSLLIERVADGVALGTIDWRPAVYGPGDASRAWQVGLSLAPEFRGQGYGAEALRLVARHLFATTGANRVEASTDVENVASRRALTKAGYVYEGTARGAQFRRGAYHDLMMFAVLRGDLADH